MENIYFKFKNHPGDLFRNSNIKRLPNPNQDPESFLIQFLPNYQSDETVALLNDLYKIVDDEFENEQNKIELLNKVGNTENINSDIFYLETQLKQNAFRNFYNLICSNKIELIYKSKNNNCNIRT